MIQILLAVAAFYTLFFLIAAKNNNRALKDHDKETAMLHLHHH